MTKYEKKLNILDLKAYKNNNLNLHSLLPGWLFSFL
jgi:hypothetical protein